jgi:hypothetical protein
MPEFDQPKEEPYHTMKVRFQDKAALDAFAKLIDQTITPKTRATWHPYKPRGEHGAKRYFGGDDEGL